MHAQVGPGARTVARLGVVFIFVRALASVKGLWQLMHLQVLYVFVAQLDVIELDARTKSDFNLCVLWITIQQPSLNRSYK